MSTSSVMPAPRIRTSRSLSHVIEYDPGDGSDALEFEVNYDPADDPVIVERTADGQYVVGYLSHDDDVESPLRSCDGMGRIYTCHRHAGHEEHAGFQKALGLDKNFERDHDVKPDPWAIKLACYDHGGQVWAIQGSAQHRSWPDQQWDVAHCGGVWVPDADCLETIKHNAYKGFLPDIVNIHWAPYVSGKPQRILVDITIGDALKAIQNWPSRVRKTELPTVVTLHKPGYKSWDNALEAALRFFQIKPDTTLLGKRLLAEQHKLCESIVEEWNKWLSGDCWAVCVEVFHVDGDETSLVDEDACWGHIGSDYATETLKQEVESKVKQLNEAHHSSDQGVHAGCPA